MMMSYDPDMTIPSPDLVRCSMLRAGKRRERPDDAVPDPAPATLSDRLVRWPSARDHRMRPPWACRCGDGTRSGTRAATPGRAARHQRSEEHTSELQSLTNLVCRLLLEKKK